MVSAVVVLVTPVFQAGIIGMADEYLQGRTRLASFFAHGRDHYLTMLVAYLRIFVVSLALVVVPTIVVAGVLLPHLDVSHAAAAGLLAIVLLPFVLFAFFLPCYGQAIVLDGAGVIGGKRRSVGLVRRTIPSTLGYNLVGVVLGGGIGRVFGGLSIRSSSAATRLSELPAVSLPTQVTAALAVTVVASVIGSLLPVFAVAFYREIGD